MKVIFAIPFLLWALFIVEPLHAQAYGTENGSVVFLSEAPLNSFEGVSEKLKGLMDFNKNLIDFYVDLNTIETGISLRDKHMRDNYLETKAFPFAEFTGKFDDLPSADFLNGKNPMEVAAVGAFSLHGVSRQIRVTGTLTPNGEKVLLSANFTVLLTDHNIEKPSLIGYELADEQKVTINAVFSPNEN